MAFLCNPNVQVHTMMHKFLTILSLFTALSLSAQLNFTRYDSYPVTDNGTPMTNPWAGGINSAQISRIDLNNDGLLDIFVFDRLGNRFLTFLNQNGNPGLMHYVHTKAYDSAFPEMSNWTLLRDFNCDGAMDIFTSGPGSMKVYRNLNGPELAFELEAEFINASYNLGGTPFDAPVYSASVDIPSITDYDGDGDLDIFVWTELASTIYYYKNMSVENSGSCGLDFLTANRCYGQFAEASESANIFILNDFECDFNVVDPQGILNPDNRSGMHTGGCICQIDLDADGLLDMIISDITETYMTELLMDEDADGLDFVYEAHSNFPQLLGNTLPIGLRTFPCCYYEDVNNDGVRDLLVSPNATIDTEDDESIWLYLNNGQDAGPQFQYTEPDFLQNTMIDMGRGAYPIPVDWNGDGLMDLVVANKEYNETVDIHAARLMLLENTGSITEPAFNIIDHNWLDIPQYNLKSVRPTFGDLDGDGDEDLVLGDVSGKLHYFQNTAGPGNPMEFVLQLPNMDDFEGNTIDVGAYSTPQIVDLDEDNLLDIVVGEKNGNVNFLKNVGTSTDFTFEHTLDTIGNVVASNLLGIQGYSVPYIWKDSANQFQMILGNEVGTLNHFDNINGNLEGDFNPVEEALDNIWEGTRSGACLYDFNNDGLMDLIYGQIGGGIAFYRGGEVPDNITESPELNATIYPNPTRNIVHMYLSEANGKSTRIKLVDLCGRIVLDKQISGNKTTLDLSDQARGVYLVLIERGNRKSVEKIVKW